MGEEKLWRFTTTFRDDPIKGCFKYKYGIYKKGHDFKVFGARIGLFSTDPSYCDERAERRIMSEVQFDVFHYPDDRTYPSKILPQSVIFYLQWLFHSIFSSNISEFLTQIEGLNFKSLITKDREVIIQWIVEQVSANPIGDGKCLYLCVVLGHIQSNSYYKLSFPSGSKTAKTCDRLLESLIKNTSSLSKSDLKALKKVATLLVENSSSPGWLSLAAYFYPYFGVKFLLEKENISILNYTYDVGKYKKIVKELFLSVKDTKNEEDKLAHQHLLHVALKHAPYLSTVLDLFTQSDVLKFFDNELEMVDFFVKFYKDWQYGTKAHMKIGGKLVEFFQIPKKFRDKLQKFLYPILLDYAKSEDELKVEHVKIFFDAIFSEDMLPLEQVQGLLMELCKSKSIPRQDLVLKILNNDLFKPDWHEIEYYKKLSICKSWVFSRIINKHSSSVSDLDRTKLAYQAIDTIMRCSLNITNANLAQDVSKYIVEKTLGNEATISILQAFTSLEKCTTVVQDCYKSHVRKLLVPNVIKKSSKLLEEYSSSRYTCESVIQS